MEIIVQDENDNTNREVYTFYVENEYHIWLDGYSKEHRLTNRHKWQGVKIYSRLDYRNYKYSEEYLEEKDVPFHDGIIRMVKDKLLTGLQIKKWSER